MDEQEGSGKRKNRLAVFEHVVEKAKNPRKRKLIRLNLEDSSPSESELVIDDDDERRKVKKKKKNPLIKLTEEPLSLQCEWDLCNDDELYDSWEKFNDHLVNHATNSSEEFICQWKNCDNKDLQSNYLLQQHMSYHAYISKLKNIGENIAERDALPKCTETHSSLIPVTDSGYQCEWEYCSFNFCTIFDYLKHMNVHIKNNPKTATKKETIMCCWKDCHSKYATQTKLADHLRIHTKEKVVGCSNCHRSFSNKTKFSDHRKRQLSSSLQNYQCSQCLKLFPTERLLRDHMRSHVNHYKCTMCDMTCPKPSILAKHIRFKHINFKPYKCRLCNKTFVEKYNLNTHLKIHEEKNPQKCLLCKFECRSKVGLDSHYVKKHDSARLIYECHCCKKKLKRGAYLTSHLTKLHNYHWPSGHSRFRYRKDQDGIYRLQTVRYESLEVTQEMIRSESMQTNNVKEAITYNLKYDNDGKSGYVLSISENGEQRCVPHTEKDVDDDNQVVITINDIDHKGNILKSQTVESTVVPATDLPCLDDVVPVENDDDSEEEESEDSKNLSMEEITVEPNELGHIKNEVLDYKMFKNCKT